jgi:hypothetical protein
VRKIAPFQNVDAKIGQFIFKQNLCQNIFKKNLKN